ncbi:hypothetical protein EVAR_16101_1 [Eumeta japonica]|uniref:Uncharacterized protein n=1 Tax=Eumeta variegata TaxID=151549 RepID=A0A4C1UIK1_EUMVA|nr:hypothetical protein EVAR_16101_1 [Eumeta japonica]
MILLTDQEFVTLDANEPSVHKPTDAALAHIQRLQRTKASAQRSEKRHEAATMKRPWGISFILHFPVVRLSFRLTRARCICDSFASAGPTSKERLLREKGGKTNI